MAGGGLLEGISLSFLFFVAALMGGNFFLFLLRHYAWTDG